MRDHCRAALTMSLHRPHRPEANPHPSPTPAPRQTRAPARPDRGGSAADEWTVAGVGVGVQGYGADRGCVQVVAREPKAAKGCDYLSRLGAKTRFAPENQLQS